VGLSATQLARGAKAGTFSLVTLLRLSIVANAPPREVLTLAGKAREAALLERAFGVTGDRLAPAEQQVIRDLRALDAPVRDSFLRLIHDCVPAQRAARHTNPRHRRLAVTKVL
jgi:hypothetical protein